MGRRKRRRRRRAKAKTLGTLGTNAANQYLEPTASPAESPKSSKSGTTPIEAHPALIRDKSPTPIPKQSTAESQSPIPDKSPSPASNQSTADSQSPASTDESGATSDGVDLTSYSVVRMWTLKSEMVVLECHITILKMWLDGHQWLVDGGEHIKTFCQICPYN